MTDIIEVSSDWLALREAEDARARSAELARAATRLLGPGPIVVHDLGSGTGSMMRWLAPLLPGPQRWVLHDWNPELIEHAHDGPAPLDRDGQPVSVASRSGQLAQLSADDLAGASLVTASALLDVLTSEEIHAIVRACVAAGCPVLLSLSVTGRVELSPADAHDEAIEAAFNAHQRRLVDGRRLLGRYGAPIARGLFLQAGWNVRPAETLWRLGDREPELLGQWLDGWIGAAAEQSAELARELDGAGYRELRAEQARRGELSAVVTHSDLLAWPR